MREENILLDIFLKIVEFLGQLGYWGITIGMTLESAAIPIPSELILPLGGFLVYQGKLTLLDATIAGVLGGLLGSVLSYGIGRWGGRPFVFKYGKYIFLNEHDLNKAERWFERYGEWAVLFSRLLPVIRTFISIPAGMGRMGFGKFLIFTFVGSLPWTYVFIYLGYRFGEHWLQIDEMIRPYSTTFAIFIAIILLLLLTLRIQKKLKKQM